MSAFWEGRRVMVTGGASFLGSAVVRRVRETGDTEVFGFTAQTSFEDGLRATIESFDRARRPQDQPRQAEQSSPR